MKIILLEDVKNLGKKGDVVEVNDGYGRNFIIPKKLGVESTPKNLNELRQQKLNEEKRLAEILAEAKKDALAVDGKTINLSIKVGKNGKAFGQVSTKEIAEETKKQLGIEIDKKKMSVETIKSAGVYKATIKFHKDVVATLKIEVKEEV